MVYLRSIIEKLKYDLLEEESIQKYCYYYISNIEHLKTLNILDDGDENILASKGYKSISPEEGEVEKILEKKVMKKIRFTSNIYRLIGIYFTSPEKIKEYVELKFAESLKYKYIIQRAIPAYREEFITLLTKVNENSDFLNVLNFIYNDFERDIDESISRIIENAPDIIDLLLLEELEKKILLNEVVTKKYINYDEKALTLLILNNFSNSINRIIKNRRKGHLPFEIKDEYDVQDLLYLVLKSVFRDLKIEEPTPQVAGKYNRIDLLIPTNSGSIMIETKMIKEKDNNEKDFIEQLKIDIQSYYKYSNLKDLIFFIYDPYGKTIDKSNFNELDGRQTINGRSFNIDVILCS